MKTTHTWLTIKDGMVLASSGIDESNANGKLILLPKESFKTAEFLRRSLMKIFRMKHLGIVITDSRLMPLRAGVVGIALGYAGFKGIKSYIGTRDIFGRVFKVSKTNVADSLATSAVLLMGEGKERQPLALITKAPVVFTGKMRKEELKISPKNDIYAPFFATVKMGRYEKQKKKK